MDATIHKNKLEFSKFRHNLHSANDRFFEKLGEINKVWALSIFFIPDISLTLMKNPTHAGSNKPVILF